MRFGERLATILISATLLVGSPSAIKAQETIPGFDRNDLIALPANKTGAARIAENDNNLPPTAPIAESMDPTKPNDPYRLEQLDSAKYWNALGIVKPRNEITATDPITVVVLDTGFEPTYPDLTGIITDSAVQNVGDITPEIDHGTKVLAPFMTANNGLLAAGISQILSERTRIITINPYYPENYLLYKDGLKRAFVDANASIISASISGFIDEETRGWIMDYLNRGGILVTAAGNFGTWNDVVTNGVSTPVVEMTDFACIRHNNVIPVGSINILGSPDGFSSFRCEKGEDGKPTNMVKLFARGSEVLVPLPLNKGLARTTGTSFATPAVTAAIVALIEACSISPVTAIESILAGARQTGDGGFVARYKTLGGYEHLPPTLDLVGAVGQTEGCARENIKYYFPIFYAS